MMRRIQWLLWLVFVVALLGCTTVQENSLEDDPQRARKAAELNTKLGVAYMREGDNNQAMTKLEKAIEQSPDYVDAHIAMAVLRDRLDEPEKAREHHLRALALAPSNPTALNNYGRFLCNQGDYDKAYDQFQKAAADPLYRTPEVPLTNAASCAIRAGDETTAEALYLEALRKNPQFAAALLPMAHIRYQQGEYLGARGYYQRYLAVSQQTPESLLLGVKIESELGGKDEVASYSLVLRQIYPDSEEAQELRRMQNHE